MISRTILSGPRVAEIGKQYHQDVRSEQSRGLNRDTQSIPETGIQESVRYCSVSVLGLGPPPCLSFEHKEGL
ncbi:hypothetical protein LB505_009987 [Fusarium chuoi]|nr:hypothetical protein LB505_009987 [Fusarium chuoi]